MFRGTFRRWIHHARETKERKDLDVNSAWLRAGTSLFFLNGAGCAATHYWNTHALFDAVGTGAFAVTSWITWYKSSRTPSQTILFACVATWALRLGTHLFQRISRTKRDPRLEALFESKGKDDRGYRFPWDLAKFWSAQAIWGFVSLLPVIAVHSLPKDSAPMVRPWTIALFCTFLALETLADVQKTRYRNDPTNAGHWVDVGVWKYSRHPNYAAEMGIWWSIYLMAVTKSTWWTILSPLGVSALLLRGSGIPVLEKLHEEKYGHDPKYQEYKRKTNALFPWPPRK